jgi:hypothetical protein
MSLPQSLRTSVTPPELELIASEQLVEIIPLVSMERTAFISVNHQSTISSINTEALTRVHTDPYGHQPNVKYRYGWQRI